MAISVYTSQYLNVTPEDLTRARVTVDPGGHPTVWVGGSQAGLHLGMDLAEAHALADAIIEAITRYEDELEVPLRIVTPG